MNPAIKFDMREFNAALQQRVNASRRTMAEVTNQSAFNVAARAMRGTKQANPQAVRSFLGAAMTDNRAIGGGAGADKADANQSNRFGSRHKRASRMLRRVVLIAQAAYFKKHGHGIGKGKSNKRTKRIRQVTASQASLFGKNGNGVGLRGGNAEIRGQDSKQADSLGWLPVRHVGSHPAGTRAAGQV